MCAPARRGLPQATIRLLLLLCVLTFPVRAALRESNALNAAQAIAAADEAAAQQLLPALEAWLEKQTPPEPSAQRSVMLAARGIIMEHTGRKDEALRLFSEPAAGVSGAWHVFRLTGNAAPIVAARCNAEAGEETDFLIAGMVRDGDAVRRKTSEETAARLFASIDDGPLRASLLTALAEFAFQEGRLTAFVKEAEERAAAAPPDRAAREEWLVSFLHGYLYHPANISEVFGADAVVLMAGLPALTPGWVYRSFRSPEIVAGNTTDFIRCVISE